MKKVIAQVCFSPSWGGLEMSAMNWAKLFAEYDCDSLLICKQDSHLHRHALQNGIKAIALDVRKVYFNARAVFQLKEILAANGVEVVFVHNLKDLWITTPALWRLPHVQCLGFARMFLKDVKKTDFLHRMLYRRLSHLIALTKPQAEALQKCLPVEKANYRIIPNYVDTKRFQPPTQEQREKARQEFGVTREDLLIGFLGRLDIQKGVGEFFEAAKSLISKYPKAHFAILGGATVGEVEFAQELIEKIQTLGHERIRYYPHRDDVTSYLHGLDLFIMPSYEETFGKVLIEAMACGVPSIATNAGGVPDIIQHEQNGLLIQPKSAEAIEQAITRLLEDSTLFEKLRKAARATVEARYTKERVFRAVEGLLEQPPAKKATADLHTQVP